MPDEESNHCPTCSSKDRAYRGKYTGTGYPPQHPKGTLYPDDWHKLVTVPDKELEQQDWPDRTDLTKLVMREYRVGYAEAVQMLDNCEKPYYAVMFSDDIAIQRQQAAAAARREGYIAALEDAQVYRHEFDVKGGRCNYCGMHEELDEGENCYERTSSGRVYELLKQAKHLTQEQPKQ